MTEREFGALPVRTVFAHLAIPNILSMLSTSLYTMADGVFVGQSIGADALAAVNLVMPILNIIFALSDMIAIGASVKVSALMGAGDIQRARHLFSAGILMCVGTGFFFLAAGVFFLKPLLYALIDDPVLADLACRYTLPFVYGFPFIMPLFALDNFMRASGKANYSMSVNVIVSLSNIALDWLLIRVLGLGIEFSSGASVACMTVGCVFSFMPFIRKKVTLRFTSPVITWKEAVGIVYNGSSEFFANIAGALMAVVVNGILLTLGSHIAVASYGIIMYIDTLLVSVSYAVTDAMMPVISYNAGAGNMRRANAFYKLCGKVAATVSLFSLAIILLFPSELAALFAKNKDAALIRLTTAAFLLYGPNYLFKWFNLVTSDFMTALDKPKESLVIMITQSVLFPIIGFVVLTPFFGINGVFFTGTLASGLTFLVAIFIRKHVAKTMRPAQICKAS